MHERGFHAACNEACSLPPHFLMHNNVRGTLRRSLRILTTRSSPYNVCRRSKAPTAFTGYSFHLIEAAIVFANEIIVCFLFPIHTGVHRAYHIFTTLIHEGAVC